MTTTAAAETEYALMVDFEDGEKPEIIPAQDVHHAANMAHSIYRGRPSWTIGRPLGAEASSSWFYVAIRVDLLAPVANSE